MILVFLLYNINNDIASLSFGSRLEYHPVTIEVAGSSPEYIIYIPSNTAKTSIACSYARLFKLCFYYLAQHSCYARQRTSIAKLCQGLSGVNCFF